jgi:hypothetical protein
MLRYPSKGPLVGRVGWEVRRGFLQEGQARGILLRRIPDAKKEASVWDTVLGDISEPALL